VDAGDCQRISGVRCAQHCRGLAGRYRVQLSFA
jgi:hypothetical protein